MNIPVSGYFYCPANVGPDNSHAHHLFITSWDGRPVHIHHFSGRTSFDVGHDHGYAGRTEPAPSGVPHVHHFFTYTTVNDGHRHEIRGVTGPAIPLPNGGHYHEFSGHTTTNGRIPHTHRYAGRTSP